MLPQSGAFVAYAGRAGRVRGVESVNVAGASLDVLAIHFTAYPRGLVRVPLERIEAVTCISKAEAAAMDEAYENRSFAWKWTSGGESQKNKLAYLADRLREQGRLGGRAKHANRQKKAAQTGNRQGGQEGQHENHRTPAKDTVCAPIS